MGDAMTGAVFIGSDDWDWASAPDLHAVRWNGHIVLVNRLTNLAACLREAAGLCKSFMEGEYHERGMWCGGWRQRESWAPGCGTSAPGFEGK